MVHIEQKRKVCGGGGMTPINTMEEMKLIMDGAIVELARRGII